MPPVSIGLSVPPVSTRLRISRGGHTAAPAKLGTLFDGILYRATAYPDTYGSRNATTGVIGRENINGMARRSCANYTAHTVGVADQLANVRSDLPNGIQRTLQQTRCYRCA